MYITESFKAAFAKKLHFAKISTKQILYAYAVNVFKIQKELCHYGAMTMLYMKIGSIQLSGQREGEPM